MNIWHALSTSKIFALSLLFAGEALTVYAEIYGAHTYQVEHEFMSVFWKMMPLVTIAGGLLVVAYILGFSVFQNIWIIGAVSMTSILIVEPFIAYSIFRQLPTKGALVGMIMGTIGLIITLYE